MRHNIAFKSPESITAQYGMISDKKNQRDIFRFIADNFKTKLPGQISVDSIKAKYYNINHQPKPHYVKRGL